MYTLPVTCKQLGVILLCTMFAGGIYLMWDTYSMDTIWIFTIGMFVTGFPTVVGLVYFIWYSYVFLDKNVKCKCDS